MPVLSEIIGIDLSIVLWAILGVGFVVISLAAVFDGLFGFADDGSIIPAIGIFMGLFGSTGLVGMHLLNLTEAAAIVLAMVVSTSGAVLFSLFVWKGLKASENTLADRRDDMIGKMAEVSITITPDGPGQITYVTDSGRNSAPARAIGGETIRQGNIVEIVNSAGTIFIVKPMTEPKNQTDQPVN